MTLSQIHTCPPTKWLVGIEDGGEKAKGKSTNTKREVKAPSVAKWLESPSALRRRSLALRAGWSFQSGILGLLAPSPIEGDNLFSADPSFTHWALLPLWPCLQPLGEKNVVVSSTQKRLPAPQTSPSPSSSPLSTHLMKTGPTGKGERKRSDQLHKRHRLKLRVLTRHPFPGVTCCFLPYFPQPLLCQPNWPPCFSDFPIPRATSTLNMLNPLLSPSLLNLST